MRPALFTGLIALAGCGPVAKQPPVPASATPAVVVRPLVTTQRIVAEKCEPDSVLEAELADAQRREKDWRAYARRLETLLNVQRPEP